MINKCSELPICNCKIYFNIDLESLLELWFIVDRLRIKVCKKCIGRRTPL